jgi:hypothetical protein
VSVETLVLRHLAEDMSIIPTAADWLQHFEWPVRSAPFVLPRLTPQSAEQLAWDSARHFDTTPEMVLPLHSWFLETTT